MHFALKNGDVYMIVKSVEEIIGENQVVGMNVIRIYTEHNKAKEELKEGKSDLQLSVSSLMNAKKAA